MCAGINSLLPSGESESKDRVGGRKTATNDNSLYPAAEMKLLLVLMSSLSLVDADSDVIGSDKPVTVTVSDNVILPCHLEPPFNVRNLTVEWKRGETIVHIYTNRKDDPGRQDKNFRGRTSVFHEEMIRGNISLKLTSITELDAGSYTCFVPKLQSQVRRGFVNLTVEPVEQKKDKGSPTHKNNRQPENVGEYNVQTPVSLILHYNKKLLNIESIICYTVKKAPINPPYTANIRQTISGHSEAFSS
ncbi:uncharacterized protein LOC127360618 isoform X1 [Dicentrarchus labrax]|uniref:Ig-like domain-containing protein n=2 Tax=Dicentrarchus labrax TaxID=13489 RepID=A0A8P4KSU2_DICLA|nr:uncharacterized protein LOC127360618 isoform X1 [Dicentrarchus labrax]